MASIIDPGITKQDFIGTFKCANCGCVFKEVESNFRHVVSITIDRKTLEYITKSQICAVCPRKCASWVPMPEPPRQLMLRSFQAKDRIFIKLGWCAIYHKIADAKVGQSYIWATLHVPIFYTYVHCKTCKTDHDFEHANISGKVLDHFWPNRC